MDFERFSKIAKNCYPDGLPYSLDDCLSVFSYFFQMYQETMGIEHPPIKPRQIQELMRRMPYIDDIGLNNSGKCEDIDVSTYPYIIDLYFQTSYKNCDYRIGHFFSGKIREIKLFEAMR